MFVNGFIFNILELQKAEFIDFFLARIVFLFPRGSLADYDPDVGFLGQPRLVPLATEHLDGDRSLGRGLGSSDSIVE